jgi:Calx-beta domain
MTSRLLPLLALSTVLSALPPTARAAGVVGSGTPESCTESALAAALAGGGSVTFDCGPAPVTIVLTAEQVITATTAIDGGGLVTLSGQNATRLFRVPDAPAPGSALTMQRIDLINGRCPSAGVEPGLGGAVWAGAGAQVVLTDVHGWSSVCDGGGAGTGGGFAYVRNGSLRLQRFNGFLNQGRDGSAVLAVDSDVTIEDSFFNSSSAVRGGILLATGGRVVFRRNNIGGVYATEAGGALHGTFAAGDGGLTIEDSRLRGLVLGGDGGAVFHQGGPLRITGSSVTGSARRGGGVFVAAGSVLDIKNSTFWQASAVDATPGDGTGRGGAMFLSGSSTGTINHTTFGSNTADSGGGAFAGDGPSAIVLRASVLENNATGSLSCSIALASGGFNVQDSGPPDADCAPGILRAGPLLGALGTHGGTTMAFDLLPASAAIDLVTSGCPPPGVDQRAVGRPQNFACDAGAIEWIPTVFASYGGSIEGNAPNQRTFDVRLSGPFNQTVTVGYATADGTATAGSDYLAASGTLTFPPGVTERTAPVTILGDQIPELQFETFELRLSAAVGGMIGDPAALWSIQDDDTVPSLSIQNCSALESQGSCAMSVQLTSIFGAPVTVSYASGGGTATAGADYAPVAGTLTFSPGSVFEPIAIVIVDDAIDEVSETFEVTLSAPQNATIGDGTGEGRIDDDDGPTVRVENVGAFEGTGANATVPVPVTLSGPSVEAIAVNLATRPGTAQSSLDYLHATPSLFFPPGSTSQMAQVTLIGDSLDEPNESFRLEITASSAPVVEGGGRVTIRDDDGGDIRLGELSHGTTLRTDLADGPDLYVLEQAEGTSWEVVVDEASGDLGNGNGPLLERIAPDLTTVYQSGAPVGTGTARTMRWASADPQYVRVASQGCGSDCGADDTYRIRAYETTLRAPRFNCVGGQATGLILENRDSHEIQARAEAFAASGQSFGLLPYLPPLPPRGVQVVDVCALHGLAGLSGSLTIAHTGSYGQLVGKVVSIDPATGASFDTPLTARAR